MAPQIDASAESIAGRRAFQRFADDLLRREVHAEQRPGHLGDLDPLVFAADAARHGGGRADADDVVAESVATPADEHRNVGALAAAIGVQLVEHEEPEPPGGPHQLAILAAREQQLQHHVVREQDVGRIPPDRLSGLSSSPVRYSGRNETGRRPSGYRPGRRTFRAPRCWLLASAFIG